MNLAQSVYDKTQFFVTGGVIFYEDQLDFMKQEIQNYKDTYFTGSLEDAEIHLQQMFKGRGKFFGLNLSQKRALLDPLYDTINTIPFTAIAIDKQKFVKRHADLNEILDYGHMLLIERYDKFLQENDCKGIVRIDRTTAPNKAELNQKDEYIRKLINKIRKRGTRWQPPAISIVEEPHFLPSHIRKGLQIADAISYCTNRKINNNSDFDSYWKIVFSKFRTDKKGSPWGIWSQNLSKIKVEDT
ncbi:MAG: DUF3800 domain-containing protein [Nitrosopumilaceae archaeon]|nr:DUF3800 domain-containing protein [Nitrosopumilaceae archaeon]